MSLYNYIRVILKGFIIFFDIVLYPMYFVLYFPWREINKRNSQRTSIEFVSDTEVIAKPVVTPYHLQVKQKQPDVNNTYELFKFAAMKYTNQPCSGTRKVLGEKMERDSSGKILKKLVMEEDYHWQTFGAIHQRIENVSNGLIVSTSASPKDIVVIYADTCCEWFLMALACFKNNYTIATLYTNLGSEGITYGIDHVKPKLIVTSQELLPKLLDTLHSVKNNVKTIIYFENMLQNSMMEEGHNSHLLSLDIKSFADIENAGKDLQDDEKGCSSETARKDDLAIIMFTSGSTGDPKGVMITHENMMETVQNQEIYLYEMFGEERTSQECYLAYLPLAHIIELNLEILFCCAGIKVAYSSPHTLTDKGLKVPSGSKGDISLLKPTYLTAVPLVLDRIYKGIMASVAAKGPTFVELFNFAYQYKKYWYKRGLDTPLLNALIFKKLQNALGGRIKMIFSGGAPLANDVNEFFKICICDQVAIGYGMTECSGGAAVSDKYNGVGECGRPLFGTIIKLESWTEGGYMITDTNGPRGEIILNQKSLSTGYYNCKDETANASFSVDPEGMRWFRTGDIGHLNAVTGSLTIVDRRKDLVKLQMGEYVSLSKVESEIKIHPLVDTVCIYAESTKTATVALILPDNTKLFELKDQLKISDGATRENLCNSPILIDFVLKDITSYVSKRLQNFEVPKGIKLVSELWTPDTGLVTSAMKLKRKQIQKQYQQDIDQMYDNISLLKSKMLNAHK